MFLPCCKQSVTFLSVCVWCLPLTSGGDGDGDNDDVCACVFSLLCCLLQVVLKAGV